MKVNFAATIDDLITGKPHKQGADDLTLGVIAIEALLAVEPKESVSGEDKLARYELAKKVKAGATEITPEEAALIKKRIGHFYGPAVVGPTWALLNG